MATVAASRNLFNDFQTAGFGFGAGTGRNTDCQALGFGGAFEPNFTVGLLVALGKGIEALKARTQRRIDLATILQLRQTNGKSHVHIEAGNTALSAGCRSRGGYV